MYLSQTLTSLLRKKWHTCIRDNLSVSDRNHTKGSTWIRETIGLEMTDPVLRQRRPSVIC